MTPSLNLTRNGLLEPLGQSQVVAYLHGLSRKYRITLISYEKDEDGAHAQRVARAQAECDGLDLSWLAQRFRLQSRVLAPALSMLRMVWLVRREVRGQGIQLIHARSHIPATVVLLVSQMMGVPFIFDMRALWPVELITAGRLRRGLLIHRAIVAAERACLCKFAGMISLTHAAVGHLKKVYPRELEIQRIVVTPTCADLDRFRPSAMHRTGPTVRSYIGTVLSGWFRIDWLAVWLTAAAAHDPSVRFDIVTGDVPKKIRATPDADGHLHDRLNIGPRLPQDMPDAVCRHDLSVMFFTDGLSKLSSSSTRMAEILGCGLPVIANDGVGDVVITIKQYRVGVLVDGPEPDQMSATLTALDKLMADLDLPAHRRAAAKEVISLKAWTDAYARLPASILGGSLKAVKCVD